MVAVAWAAIGLLAASLLGSLYYLGSRIDALAARLDARIDSSGAELGGRIEGLSHRIGNLGRRFDAHLERHTT